MVRVATGTSGQGAREGERRSPAPLPPAPVIASQAGAASQESVLARQLSWTKVAKQGALLALGLVLQQENPVHLPRVAALKERLNKIITGKTDGHITKMGAILALGLMGVGGQNCTVGI